MTDTDDIGRLSYEQALAELDGLITRLEGGAVDLDEAIACYERGSRLAQRCAELLDRTEQRVMQLVVGSSGTLQERPLAAEAGVAPAPAAGPAAEPPADAGGEPPRPIAPPPPGSPVRARSARPDPPLLPGLDPQPPVDKPDFDVDDIPF